VSFAKTATSGVFWGGLGVWRGGAQGSGLDGSGLFFRLLAVRSVLVQRVRDVRRAGVFVVHTAHGVHLPQPLPGHTEPA